MHNPLDPANSLPIANVATATTVVSPEPESTPAATVTPMEIVDKFGPLVTAHLEYFKAREFDEESAMDVKLEPSEDAARLSCMRLTKRMFDWGLEQFQAIAPEPSPRRTNEKRGRTTGRS